MKPIITFLSPSEASRVLGVTPATVRLMVRRGDLIVAALTEGGMRLFERKDVEALARRRGVAQHTGGARDGAQTDRE